MASNKPQAARHKQHAASAAAPLKPCTANTNPTQPQNLKHSQHELYTVASRRPQKTFHLTPTCRVSASANLSDKAARALFASNKRSSACRQRGTRARAQESSADDETVTGVADETVTGVADETFTDVGSCNEARAERGVWIRYPPTAHYCTDNDTSALVVAILHSAL